MSDINIKKEKARRIALLYLAFTVLSVLFAIYMSTSAMAYTRRI